MHNCVEQNIEEEDRRGKKMKIEKRWGGRQR